MTLVSKPLVVLDSNALFDDPYISKGHSARLIALARSSKIDLAISEVVLLELQRQQRRTVTGRVDYLQKAEEKIQDSLRTLQLDADAYSVRLPDFTSLDAEGILADAYSGVRERLLANSVEILPIPTVSHAELLTRDLVNRLPFDTNGKGYRDALIWHSWLLRWEDTPLFEDGYIVTADDDFGKDRLDPELVAELPLGSTAVKVSSIPALFGIPKIAALYAQMQSELEVAALASSDRDLVEELAARDNHVAMSEAVEAAVSSAIDSLGGESLSDMQRSNLQLPRAFDSLELSVAFAKGDFEWVLYEQLDGETLLGQASMTAEVELAAEVEKEDAAVLADPDVHIERWEYDVAHVSTWRDARLTFDVRVDVPGVLVEDVTFSSIESMN
jgi:hypothetical protein